MPLLSTPALEAHLRCMERMSERIRTHLCKPPRARGERYKATQVADLKARLLELQAQGMDRKRMARECRTSSKTIVKLLGRVRFW